MHTRAFSPGQITGFFQAFPHGSTGASINLGKGMITEVSETPGEETSYSLNGGSHSLPVSETVLRHFLERYPEQVSDEVAVTHIAELPVGFGTGMSAAGALSLSLALNALFHLHLSEAQCIQIAFEAELSNSTGLNGVKGLPYSGLIIGTAPDATSTPHCVPLDGFFLVCAFLEPMDTKSIIRGEEWIRIINTAGGKALDRLVENPSPSAFIRHSRAFTTETGLASPTILEIMRHIPTSSMAMLGQTVFALTRDPEPLEKQFARYSDDVRITPLSERGAYVMNDED